MRVEANATLCGNCDALDEFSDDATAECDVCGFDELIPAFVEECDLGSACEADEHDYGKGKHVKELPR